MTAPWILGIVGVLGVGGTIAAAIFFPAVVIPLLQNLVSWLVRCTPCLIALAFIAVGIGSYWFGHHQAVVKCHEAELAAELRNKQIDLDNANKATADETERAKSIEEQARARQKDDADYIAHLQNRPACVIDDNDLVGLPDHGSGTGVEKAPAHPN